MTEDEVQEVVSGAVEVTEQNPEAILPVRRAQMATWLYTKYRIAIKELVVSIKDGMPYLLVEYVDDEGATKETKVDMSKYTEKLTSELSKMGEKLRTPGA